MSGNSNKHQGTPNKAPARTSRTLKVHTTLLEPSRTGSHTRAVNNNVPQT